MDGVHPEKNLKVVSLMAIRRLAFAVTAACFLLAFQCPNSCAAAKENPLPWCEEYVGRSYDLLPAVNQSPIVYSCSGGECYTLELAGGMFPLLVHERVTITQVEAHKSGRRLDLKVNAKRLGSGKFVFRVPETSADLLTPEAVDRLIAIISDEPPLSTIVGDSITKRAHFLGSNHSPSHDDTVCLDNVDQAVARGYELCSICFAQIHQIPDYHDERMLGRLVAGEVRSNYMVVQSDEQQAYIQSIGSKVLRQWPLPLRGYQYKFTLVEMEEVNAIACPGGWVFVGTGLLASCESESELEAVLAHEIAHVEMRHGYRRLMKAQRDAAVASLLVGLVGVAASESGDAGTTRTAMAVASVMAEIALELVFNGYSRENEWEADAYSVNYLTTNYGDTGRAGLVSVLKKLQYSSEVQNSRRYRSSSIGTHPDLGSRVKSARESRVEFFDPPILCSVRMGEETGMDLVIHGITLFQTQNLVSDPRRSSGPKKEQLVQDTIIRIFATASATGFFGGPRELKDMKGRVDGVEFRFDNDEDTLVVPGKPVSISLAHTARREAGDELVLSSLEISDIRPNLTRVKD